MDKTIDYDRPRGPVEPEPDDASVQELKLRYGAAVPAGLDRDDAAESPELPGADLSNLSGEDLRVPVVPKQDDEFVCARCFLIQNRRRLARRNRGQPICRDCA